MDARFRISSTRYLHRLTMNQRFSAGLGNDAALAGLDGVHYDLDLDAAPAVEALVDVDPVLAFLE